MKELLMKDIHKVAITISGFVILIAIIFGLSGCAACSRNFKSFDSDINGGLNRKVTLYDYNGKVIKEWEGKFDVADGDQEMFFDIDGKRVIIQGGIIVNEEF